MSLISRLARLERNNSNLMIPVWSEVQAATNRVAARVHIKLAEALSVEPDQRYIALMGEDTREQASRDDNTIHLWMQARGIYPSGDDPREELIRRIDQMEERMREWNDDESLKGVV